MKSIEMENFQKLEFIKVMEYYFFSYSELEKDSLLKETLSLSVQRDICVEKKMIIDRGTKYKVIYFKHRYYWHEGKNLKVYTLDNKAIRKE
jgi:hypothetical protein